MSFARLLDEAARRYPARVALIDGNQRRTFAGMDAEPRSVARNLAVAGVRPGARVALHMMNRLELAVLYFACARAGAIAVPINTRLKPPEIGFILQHSGASAYVGSSVLAQLALSGQAPAPERVFVIGCGTDARPFTDLLTDRPAICLPSVHADEAGAILYTSGSTARPKGVVYGHRGIVAGALLGQPGILTDSVVAQATSMLHAGGFSNLMASVHVGATSVLLPCFDADLVLDAIERHHCTYFSGLPFMFEALVERQLVRPRDVASTTIFHAGGDAVSPALQKRFATVFGHPLREGYGSTEAGRVTHQPANHPVRVGSIGVPIAGIRVNILDSEGREVSAGEPGELMIRTPAVMTGYWQDPQASGDVLRDGWLRSGDIAVAMPTAISGSWGASRRSQCAAVPILRHGRSRAY